MLSLRRTNAVIAACGCIAVLALIIMGATDVANGDTLGTGLMLQIIGCFLIAIGNSMIALDRGNKSDLFGSIAILSALAFLIIAMIV